MKRKFLLNRLGVSLMEAMVVIIIIAVLLLIWKFVSGGHVKLAIVNEGRMFVEKVVAQEKMYKANTGSFITSSTSGNDVTNSKKSDKLMINTYDNKYFLTFTVASTSAGFNVVAFGTGKANSITVTGVYTASNNNLSIVENGLGL